MIKKYILTSPKFNGGVVFGYDANNCLVFYHNECDSPAAINWLKDRLPGNDIALVELKKKIEGTIQVVPPDLSFDTFWEAYDKKINRKRCEPLWKKLNDADRMRAIMNIKPYDAYLQRTGIAKCMAENYLKKEYYTVDWAKER